MNEMDNITENFWNNILEKVKEDTCISHITYSLCLEDLRISEIKGNEILIMTSKNDEGILAYLEEHFKSAFENALSEYFNGSVYVRFVNESGKNITSLCFLDRYEFLMKYVEENDHKIDPGVLTFIAHYVEGNEYLLKKEVKKVVDVSKVYESIDLLHPSSQEEWFTLGLVLRVI